MNSRKAMSMPMEIIIAVVILVVIALAVIMMTTGSITNFGKNSGDTGGSTANSIQCQSDKLWCNDHPGEECEQCAEQDSCGSRVICPGSKASSTPTPATNPDNCETIGCPFGKTCTPGGKCV